MKEFEITVRIKNNRLKERRDALGVTQADLAIIVGINVQTYNQLENMRLSPISKKLPDQWHPAAEKLAEYYNVSLDELFTEAICNVERSTMTRRLDAKEIKYLTSSSQTRLLEASQDPVNRIALHQLMQKAIPKAGLIYSEQYSLTHAYGLLGAEVMSITDIADKFGVDEYRVENILKTARRKVWKTKFFTHSKRYYNCTTAFKEIQRIAEV